MVPVLGDGGATVQWPSGEKADPGTVRCGVCYWALRTLRSTACNAVPMNDDVEPGCELVVCAGCVRCFGICGEAVPRTIAAASRHVRHYPEVYREENGENMVGEERKKRHEACACVCACVVVVAADVITGSHVRQNYVAEAPYPSLRGRSDGRRCRQARTLEGGWQAGPRLHQLPGNGNSNGNGKTCFFRSQGPLSPEECMFLPLPTFPPSPAGGAAVSAIRVKSS